MLCAYKSIGAVLGDSPNTGRILLQPGVNRLLDRPVIAGTVARTVATLGIRDSAINNYPIWRRMLVLCRGEHSKAYEAIQ